MPFTDDPLFWPTILLTVAVQPILVVKLIHILVGVLRPRIERWRRRCSRDNSDPACESADAEVRELVKAELELRRVYYARMVLLVVWIVFAFRAAFILIEFGIKGERPDASAGIMRSIAFILVLVILTLGAVFPESLVTAGTVPVWMWFGTLIMCAILLSAIRVHPPVENAMLMQPTITMLSITLGGIYLHFRALVLASICISCSYVVAFAFAQDTCHGGSFSVTVQDVAAVEFLVWSWKVAVFYWAERAAEYSARREVEAALGKCQESAVSSLLHLVCDVVVDLDHNAVLKDHSVKLAGMLMHGAGKPLRGLPFSEFIAQGEDQQRFNDLICKCRTSRGGEAYEPSPQMVKVRIRDAMGNLIKVLLYHVPYLGVSGRFHHLIGLQEAGEELSATCMDSVGDLGDARLAGLHRQRPLPAAVLSPEIAMVVGRATPSSSLGSPPGSISSGRSSSRGTGSPTAAASAAETMTAFGSLTRGRCSSRATGSPTAASTAQVMTVDVAASAGLPIHAMDDAIRQRYCGAGDAASFAEMLRDGSGDFVDRVVSAAENVRRGDVPPHVSKLGVFPLLSTRAGGAPQVDYCMLRVYFPPPPVDEEEAYLISIRLNRQVQLGSPAIVRSHNVHQAKVVGRVAL